MLFLFSAPVLLYSRNIFVRAARAPVASFSKATICRIDPPRGHSITVAPSEKNPDAVTSAGILTRMRAMRAMRALLDAEILRSGRHSIEQDLDLVVALRPGTRFLDVELVPGFAARRGNVLRPLTHGLTILKCPFCREPRAGRSSFCLD